MTYNGNTSYYIDLPYPTKVNIYLNNTYRLMGITGPKYKYIKIYNYINYVLCYDTCSSCKIGENGENQICTVVKIQNFY